MMFAVRSFPSTLLLAAALLGGASATRADAPKATLQKVKQATVYLQVKTSGGAVYEGTGFCVGEPGLVVTNAHVLGMLEPNSRKPLQVVVVVNSGEAGSKTYRGQVLGADRGTDLAVLRIQGNALPEPLKLAPSKDLTETQEVFIFGFPFGKRLGKNITVSKSSISSLRKSVSGRILKVQVNGGMNPGNSGGPLTNAEGQVVGVAVSAVKNSSIHFAIPGDRVREFLDGRLDTLSRMTAYHDGDKIKMPVRVHLIDPLGRVAKVAVELWTAPAGNKLPATGAVEPPPMAGAANKQVFTLTYDKKGTGDGEVVLPKLTDPKQVYWIRPVVTQASGEKRWAFAAGRPLGMLVERKPAQLKYQPTAKPMFLDLNSKAELRLRDPDGEEGKIRSNFAVILREQPSGASAEGGGSRFRTTFQRVAAGISINDKPLTGKGDTVKILNDTVRFLALNIEMDGDGNQTRAEADFGRAPRETRERISDISDQVLQSLSVMTVSLPGGTLPPLKTWKTQRLLEIGPLGMALPAQADLEYTYLGLRDLGGQKQAVLHMEGKLRGQRANAGNVGGSVTGTLMVSPETGQVVQGLATIKVDMDLPIKQQVVKANGELAVNFKRADKPPASAPAQKK